MGGVVLEVVGSLGFCFDFFDLFNFNLIYRYSRGYLFVFSFMILGYFFFVFDFWVYEWGWRMERIRKVRSRKLGRVLVCFVLWFR